MCTRMYLFLLGYFGIPSMRFVSFSESRMYFARSFGAQDYKRCERFHLVVVVVAYYLQMFPAILPTVLLLYYLQVM